MKGEQELTQVMHRVTFSGWLAGALMFFVGRELAAHLPVTLIGLKKRVEEHVRFSSPDPTMT
jgi:hypothetical protein